MFVIYDKDVVDDPVELIHSCISSGKLYCKYGNQPYKIVDTDELRNHLLNDFYDIHEMIHIVDDDMIELIYHDRYSCEFITYLVKQFWPTLHMDMIDEFFESNTDMNHLERSWSHTKLIYENSYQVGAYE